MPTEKVIDGKTYVEHELTCPDCGKPMSLRPSKYGLFYGCTGYPNCRGTHGAHPSGVPLGTPAKRETKDRRIKAHAYFDRLWKTGRMKRNEAYYWLAEQLGMDRKEVHIGSFTAEQCDRVIEVMMKLEANDGV